MHAKVWETQSGNLADVARMLDGLQFRHVTAPTFGPAVTAHEGLVTAMRAKCAEGAAVWSALAQFLGITYQVYDDNQQEAVRALHRLRQDAADQQSHPARRMLGVAP
ncbi:hypothetical protein [Plantactinospora mayteni]|nr:hypothetical protein [Plantactinospora mayteni]